MKVSIDGLGKPNKPSKIDTFISLPSGQQSGTGLGDGEGDKATTEDLESEDIFDTAEKPGQKQEKNNDDEKPETKEEQVCTAQHLLSF